jgi:putative membrane protein
MGHFILTIFYAIIGVVLMGISYKLYDMFTPFDINKELEDDKNIAVGLVLASVILGISLIVAAAILRAN